MKKQKNVTHNQKKNTITGKTRMTLQIKANKQGSKGNHAKDRHKAPGIGGSGAEINCAFSSQ